MKVQILDKELYTAAELHAATEGSAGLDLKLVRDARSAMFLACKAGQSWPYHDLIGTGLAVAIPRGWCGLLVPRSSTGHKQGFKLGNTIGVIDSDYRGEIMLSVSAGDYQQLVRGAKVAQLVLVPHFALQTLSIVDSLDETVRGDGGFGSSNAYAEDESHVNCPYCTWSGELPVDGRCPECLADLGYLIPDEE